MVDRALAACARLARVAGREAIRGHLRIERACAFAGPEVAALTSKPVLLLEGGTAAWIAAGLPLAKGETHLASPRIDRYRRPYEGTDAPHEAMNAYLEWEYGLVAQLERDGTHGFFVI